MGSTTLTRHNELSWRFRTPAALQAWGRKLADILDPEDIVALVGELGAGKTTLVQGIASGWGYKRGAISPTFAIANEYETPKGPIFHMDMYRLSPAELLRFPFQDYWGTGLCLIEWADRIRERWPETMLEIRLSPEGDKTRRVRIVPRSASWRKRLAPIFSH